VGEEVGAAEDADGPAGPSLTGAALMPRSMSTAVASSAVASSRRDTGLRVIRSAAVF
jgi:hypothetical protein